MGTDDHQTNSIVTSSQKRNHRWFTKLLLISGVVALIVGCSSGMYLWQHHRVVDQSKLIDSLQTSNDQLKKKSSSLASQVSILNKSLQAALSSSSPNNEPSATSNAPTVPSADDIPATSNLIINDVKQVAGDTVNHYVKSTDTYWIVDFTIYNNSATQTQTYTLNLTDSYFKGVGSTGEIIDPYNFGGENIGWYRSTILPGGNAKGVLMFDFNAPLSVKKIQWQAPDGSPPVTLNLPDPS